MAIHYYDEFSSKCSSRNFGDDINPFLLGKLLRPSILKSEEVCVLGIGSILNRRNAGLVSRYRHKVVFSSGTGYGQVETGLDDSWDVVCVRGPNTAAAMGLPPASAICDGAILLSDFFEPVPESGRSGIVFIPHIKTHWAAGEGLHAICADLKWRYLTPDLPAEVFIDGVRSSRLVITEAMHGAILADTMRVPWIPVAMHQHNEFKWRDWFLSVEQAYRNNTLSPALWNFKNTLTGRLKYPYQQWKIDQLKRQVRTLADNASPFLSSGALMGHRKNQLREKLDYINQSYGI